MQTEEIDVIEIQWEIDPMKILARNHVLYFGHKCFLLCPCPEEASKAELDFLVVILNLGICISFIHSGR